MAEGKLSVTFKGGSQKDAPWLVVSADTVKELNDFLYDQEMPELLDGIHTMADAFVPESRRSRAAPPVRAACSPDGTTMNCPGGHGQTTYKAWTKDDGTAFKGFFCEDPECTLGRNGQGWAKFL